MNQLHQDRVKNLQQEDFESWKQQPESRIFFNYLKDFQEEIGNTYKAHMLSGSLQSVPDRVITMEEGKCVLLEDLIGIELDDLQSFYEVDENE